LRGGPIIDRSPAVLGGHFGKTDKSRKIKKKKAAEPPLKVGVFQVPREETPKQ
jgi:hypothetical protein